MNGKNWKKIATDVGTKNEQQCRTRGLILFNKLQRHCWDEELYNILKPHQGNLPRKKVPDDPNAPVDPNAPPKKKRKRDNKRRLKKISKEQKIFDFNNLNPDGLILYDEQG